MPFSLNQVHVFAVVEGQAQPKLVAEHHYIRLKGSGAEYPLYIQEGQVYGEGGDLFEPEDYPKWFWREVKKCSPESLLQVGWSPTADEEDDPEIARKAKKKDDYAISIEGLNPRVST